MQHQVAGLLVGEDVGMLILCGMPGSGKSTLARSLAARDWVVVNQDSLGHRRACEQNARLALERGARVVVDRCNHDPTQRAHWTRLAPAVAVWLDADVELCVARVLGRAGHPTLAAEPKSEDVVRRFASIFEPPTIAEPGLTAVHRIPVPLEMSIDDLADRLSPPWIPRSLPTFPRPPRSARSCNAAPRRPHPPRSFSGGRPPRRPPPEALFYQHAAAPAAAPLPFTYNPYYAAPQPLPRPPYKTPRFSSQQQPRYPRRREDGYK
ncbi:hypothetical protein CTAYLR_005649 [Chrysophaeum taylorii]|uniref:Uncharacterized protein n=1 Tax=Chrysophaeum taylorii TaxID=2483200 RepID=A0AAD7UKP0_9STRA|nr:hypothetical protein CTAYLR_005649 [Chrysophaeum taylorii]